jgi:hypothetical protein
MDGFHFFSSADAQLIYFKVTCEGDGVNIFLGIGKGEI